MHNDIRDQVILHIQLCNLHLVEACLHNLAIISTGRPAANKTRNIFAHCESKGLWVVHDKVPVKRRCTSEKNGSANNLPEEGNYHDGHLNSVAPKQTATNFIAVIAKPLHLKHNVSKQWQLDNEVHNRKCHDQTTFNACWPKSNYISDCISN